MRLALLVILIAALIAITACGTRRSSAGYDAYSPGYEAGNAHRTLADDLDTSPWATSPDAMRVGASIESAPASPLPRTSTTESRDLGPAAQNEQLPPPTPKGARSPERRIDEPGFSTAEASTFAIDVDSGSWNFARQALRDGRQPAAEAIRVEEFINAFHYQYAQPAGDAPLGWDWAYGPCPWNPSHNLLRVALQAREVPQGERPATNLVLLIDTSGSMSPRERLPLLKSAFLRLVDHLDARDRVAIVTYAGSSEIALEPTAGSDHRRIRDAIERLGSGGGTHGSDGIITAYDLARRSFVRSGQNRVMLATDGDFNIGITDEAELERLIRNEAASGVLLTVLGVGDSAAGDRQMEHLADCGNGVYAFLDNDAAASHALDEQLTANLVTVAKDAKIQLFFNPATVAGWRLIGYANRQLARRDFNDDRIDGGEVGAGHQVTALYEIIPAGDANPYTKAGANDLCRLRLRWQPVEGGASRLLESDVSASRDATLDRDSGWAAAIAMVGLKLHGDMPQLPWATVFELADRCATTPERREAVLMLKQAFLQLSRR